MLPTFELDYANPASATHWMGQRAHDLIEAARSQIATAIHAASSRDIIFTSGATESNNLAFRGLAERRHSGHIISVATEHPSVISPLEKLGRQGFRITFLPVRPAGHRLAGTLDLDQLRDAICDDTFLCSVMLANNEIGTIQSLESIADVCREHGIRLHTDASQGVGKLFIDVQTPPVDLMSFSAHKIYGPKGVGALYVRRTGDKPVRLISQIDGGKQELGLRGGTSNVPGIVGFAAALALSLENLPDEQIRLARLRNQLHQRLCDDLGEVPVNGPELDIPDPEFGTGNRKWVRLPGNLNCQFPGLDGHTLMVRAPEVCLSSGSACTATNSEPSHVLRSLGLDDDRVRCSIRFGLGRFNTAEDIARAAEMLIAAAKSLK